jgi:hypothetical protein
MIIQGLQGPSICYTIYLATKFPITRLMDSLRRASSVFPIVLAMLEATRADDSISVKRGSSLYMWLEHTASVSELKSSSFILCRSLLIARVLDLIYERAEGEPDRGISAVDSE